MVRMLQAYLESGSENDGQDGQTQGDVSIEEYRRCLLSGAGNATPAIICKNTVHIIRMGQFYLHYCRPTWAVTARAMGRTGGCRRQ